MSAHVNHFRLCTVHVHLPDNNTMRKPHEFQTCISSVTKLSVLIKRYVHLFTIKYKQVSKDLVKLFIYNALHSKKTKERQ